MAELKTIMETETASRQAGEVSTIFLYPEGKFYHAYEWSAWLFVHFINAFKVSKREWKANNSHFVVIGFPLESLEKHVPDTARLVNNDPSGRVDIILPQTVFEDIEDFATLEKQFNDWKASIALSEPTKKKSDFGELGLGMKDSGPTFHKVSEILSEIVKFPIEQKSPMECVQFISKLKEYVSEII